MSPVIAVLVLVLLFVLFGFLHRGMSKPQCAGCEHRDTVGGCGECDPQAPPRMN